MTKNKLKTVFISWAPYCSRSDNIAREFGGISYMVYYPFFGSNYLSIFFKYLFQMIKSFIILFREKPDVVFVMNTPIFACIPAWVYCKLFPQKGYITDSHAAAFNMKIWQKFFFMQKFFFRNAITNIVTNKPHRELIESWKADCSMIGDIPVKFRKMTRYGKFKKGFNITVVNSFSITEPLWIILSAASKFPEISFYITGSLKDADENIKTKAPENVIFTDFIPDDEYAWLLKNSDVIMTQCTNDNTMQRGAYEAMSLERPIITSDWGILRETFYKGALFTDTNVDSTIGAIDKMKKNIRIYEKEVSELKEERFLIWNGKRRQVEKKIETALNP